MAGNTDQTIISKTENSTEISENRMISLRIPLKKEMVAGVTVLTLGSGGSSFLMWKLFIKAGLLSMMATVSCFVNGIVAA